MDVQYVNVTPDLKEKYREQSGSNASDFIRFDENYCSAMALVEQRPVALIVAKRRHFPEPLPMVSEAFIDIIEVLPAYQRRGIGTALLELVIQWAKENQVSQVRAWSEEIRREALLLWNKMGFTFSWVDFQNGAEKRYGFYVAKRLYQAERPQLVHPASSDADRTLGRGKSVPARVVAKKTPPRTGAESRRRETGRRPCKSPEWANNRRLSVVKTA